MNVRGRLYSIAIPILLALLIGACGTNDEGAEPEGNAPSETAASETEAGGASAVGRGLVWATTLTWSGEQPNTTSDQPVFRRGVKSMVARIEAVIVVPNDPSSDAGRVCSQAAGLVTTDEEECLVALFAYDVDLGILLPPGVGCAELAIDSVVTADGRQVESFVDAGASGAIPANAVCAPPMATDERVLFVFPGAAEGSQLALELQGDKFTWIVPEELPELGERS